MLCYSYDSERLAAQAEGRIAQAPAFFEDYRQPKNKEPLLISIHLVKLWCVWGFFVLLDHSDLVCIRGRHRVQDELDHYGEVL